MQTRARTRATGAIPSSGLQPRPRRPREKPTGGAAAQEGQSAGAERPGQQIPRGIAAQILSTQEGGDQETPARRAQEEPEESLPQQPLSDQGNRAESAAEEQQIQHSLELGEVNSNPGGSETREEQEQEGESDWLPEEEDQDRAPGSTHTAPMMSQSTPPQAADNMEQVPEN